MDVTLIGEWKTMNMKRKAIYTMLLLGTATVNAQVTIQNTSSNTGVVNLGGGNVGSVSIDGNTVSTGNSGVLGSGQSVTHERNLELFTQITVEIAGNVRVSVGPQPRVKIQADTNVVDLITSKITAGTLTLSATKPFTSKVPIQIEIIVPSITNVTLAGAGSIDVAGVSGKSLELTLGGSGDITANGNVEDLIARINGSGNLALGGLKARKGRVAIEGVGDIEVFVKDELFAEISGTGEIIYRGSPTVKTKISGVGDVVAASDRE